MESFRPIPEHRNKLIKVGKFQIKESLIIKHGVKKVQQIITALQEKTLS